MHPMRVLFLSLRLSIPVATGYLLGTWLGAAMAMGVAALLAVLLSGVGAWLLQRSKVGEVTWRNRIAAWLLPYGYKLARGRLPGIAAVSAVVFAAIAGAVILAMALAATGQVPVAAGVAGGTAPTTGMSWLLVVAWLVDGGALLHLLSTLSQLPAGSSPARTLWKLVTVVVLLLVGSVVLLLAGHADAALWVAGGPPLGIGVCYGLFVLLLVTAGRNARWN